MRSYIQIVIYTYNSISFIVLTCFKHCIHLHAFITIHNTNDTMTYTLERAYQRAKNILLEISKTDRSSIPFFLIGGRSYLLRLKTCLATVQFVVTKIAIKFLAKFYQLIAKILVDIVLL